MSPGSHAHRNRQNTKDIGRHNPAAADKTTKEISEAVQPQTLGEHESVAKRGGGVAREARLKLEAETGSKQLISPKNAKQLGLLSKGNKLKGSSKE